MLVHECFFSLDKRTNIEAVSTNAIENLAQRIIRGYLDGTLPSLFRNCLGIPVYFLTVGFF